MINISQRQNDPKNINRLAAQRQIYSSIKLLMLLSFFVGVVTPILASMIAFFLNNDYFSSKYNFEKIDIGYISVLLGIVCALFIEWQGIFVKRKKEDAAKIQECFDTSVFNLSWDETGVGSVPDVSLELINSRKFNERNPSYSGFLNWYTEKAASFGYPEAIAFCQQQNLCWDSSLRKKIIVSAEIVLFFIISSVLLLGFFNDLQLRSFIANAIAPLLPICLFFYKLINEHRDTVVEMERLRGVNDQLIESILSNNAPSDEILKKCRNLQTAIYNHRKSARPIPNFLHKINKKFQEEESDYRMQQHLDRMP